MPEFRPLRIVVGVSIATFAVVAFASVQSAAQPAVPSIRTTAPCPGGGDDAGLPLGFRKVIVTSGVEQPVAIVFAEDGRLFIGERLGRVRIMADGVLRPAPVLTLTNIDTYSERGLHGLALDPDFISNGWLYIRYTTAEPRNRLSRFQVIADIAEAASEIVLWEAPQLAHDWHHGGAVEFGPDGKLYTSVGDNVDPPTAQNPSLANGKILRLNADGSAPADNPFVGQPDADPRVWALGLRSPFRFSFDRPTGRLWFGDVGSGGPTAREEINLCEAGANFGWPNQEGEGCYVENCAGYSTPVFAYAHDDPEYSLDRVSAAVILGPVYRGDAYPAEFVGNLFFADYANSWIRRLILNPDGTAVGDEPFMVAPTAGSVVDLRVGPDNLLYFAVIGFGKGTVPGVYRIEFDPNYDRPPVAVASASPHAGDLPLRVQFSSAESYDPDGKTPELSYCWDFGDGSTSPDANPLHTYIRPGMFEARLTVYSGDSSDIADPISIVATNPPLARIITPAAGTIYRAGDLIRFSGAGYDEEDGWLDEAAFSWELHLIHASHVHPLLGPLTGVKFGEFSVAADGHSPENTHYSIRLTLTDSDGLSATVETEIFPEATWLTFSSDPPGVAIVLDHEPTTTPREVQSVVGFRHALEAPESVEIDGRTFLFREWSNGQPREQTFEVPAGGATLVATYSTVEVEGDVEPEAPTASDRTALCPLVGSLALLIGAAGCVLTRPHQSLSRCGARPAS